MQHIAEGIESGATGDELAHMSIPQEYRAAHVLKAEQEMWVGTASEDKDPRSSLHVGSVPTPDLAPDEAYVAVMASSINFNTVWSSIFEPVSTFGPLARLARESEWASRHDRDDKRQDGEREQQRDVSDPHGHTEVVAKQPLQDQPARHGIERGEDQDHGLR